MCALNVEWWNIPGRRKKISSKFLETHISSWTFGPNPSQQEDEWVTDVSQYHKE